MKKESSAKEKVQTGYLGRGAVVPFFKDQRLFSVLENNIFPALFDKRAEDEPVRVWVPGCSTGEEVYSMAIVLDRLLSEVKRRKQIFTALQIVGTDSDGDNIKKSRLGVFEEKSLRNISDPDRRRYFQPFNHIQYKIKPFVRDKCIFGTQDILNDPMLTGMEVVDLSNLVLKYNPGLQVQILNRICFSLKAGGFLLLDGWKIPKYMRSFFEVVDEKLCLYRRKSHPDIHFDQSGYPENTSRKQKKSVISGKYRDLTREDTILDREQLSATREELMILSEELLTSQQETERRNRQNVRIKDDLNNILNAIDSAVVVLDRNFHIDYFNMAGGKLFNISPHDIGRTITDLRPNVQIEDLTPFLRKAVKNKKQVEQEVLDEKGVTYLIRIKPVRDRKGSLARIIMNCMDIQAMKQTEEKLRFHSEVLASIRDAVIAVDNEARVTYFNREAAKRYGIKAREALGKKLSEIYSSEFYTPEDEKKADASLAEKGHWMGENIHIAKNGKRLYVESIVNTIKDEKGRPVGLQGVMRDITQRKLIEMSLKESKDRLRAAMDSGRMFAFEWCPNIDKLIRSEQSADILGIKKDPTKDNAKRYFQSIHPDDRDKYIHLMHNLSPSNHSYGTSYRVKRADNGEYIFLGEKGEAHFDEKGKLTKVSGLAADITADKKAEEAIRESEERLRLAAEAAGFGMFDADLVSNRSYWSPQLKAILGLPVATEPPPPGEVYKFMHPDDAEHIRQIMKQAFDPAGDGWVKDEHRIIRPDGSIRWVMVKGQVIFTGEGPHRRPVRSRGIMLDITERKQADQALRQSERQFRAIFDATQEGAVLLDDQRRCLKANPAAGRLTGLSHELLTGRSVEEFLEPGVPLETAWPVFIQTGTFSGEVRVRNIDGTYRTLDAMGVARVLPGRHLFVGHDVTDRKKTEEILKRDKIMLENLVKEKTREMMRAQEEIDRSKRLVDIGTLAATVAHELRNPLAAINMSAYNIERKINDPSISGNLKSINEKVFESERIINNLLFFSRMRPPQRQKTFPYDILEECLWAARERTGKKVVFGMEGIEPAKGQAIEADPLQLKEVFSNLLNNAIDAVGGENARVVVGARPRDNVLEITFQDNGKGIDEEDLKKVFDPFFTTKAKGTGLGLTVCRQIIQLHKGIMQVESKKGKGTTVLITLPMGSKRKHR